MNLRPINEELVITCFQNAYCTECELRVGCPVRYYFYDGDDLSHEISLQMAEIKLSEEFPENSTLSFELANNLRKKRNRELSEKPFFSFV